MAIVDNADTDTESESGDYLDLDGAYAFEDDMFYDAQDSMGSEDAKFPPPLSDYRYHDPSAHPKIGFNEGRNTAWAQCQKEANFFRQKLGIKGKGPNKMFKKMFGEDSELYAKIKKIGVKSFEEYSKFLATFFFECRFSVTYERMVNDPDVNTSSYMDLDRYKAIWRMFDHHKMNETYSK